MAKIVTVYEQTPREYDKRYRDLVPTDMSYIRWYKVSEILARLGHQVDMAIPDLINVQPNQSEAFNRLQIRMIPLSKIKWDDYDVVKTLFNKGFDTLEKYGGSDHPFIISKLGSVVGPEDMDGIYFYAKKREKLYSIQEKINQTSKYITVLSKSAKELWIACFGPRENILIVPGGVDNYVPPPGQDPYPSDEQPRCLFAGNVYTLQDQPEANAVLVEKLNKLGMLLSCLGMRLFMLGEGDLRKIDKRYVTHLGVVSYEKTWNYLHFAQVGVVVAAGKFMHNNESSKIYHYLRVGLPVVSEAGFPNDHILTESKLGFVVENGNLELMAQRIKEAAHKVWDRDYAINYILNNHTWNKRFEIYDKIINESLIP